MFFFLGLVNANQILYLHAFRITKIYSVGYTSIFLVSVTLVNRPVASSRSEGRFLEG